MAGNVLYSIDFAAQIARLVEGTEQSSKAVKSMADQIESASSLAKSALGALGIELSVSYFTNLIGGAIEAHARLGELAIVAGTTAAEFSKFEEPARTSGTSLDTVAVSVSKLSRALGEARLGDADKKNLFRAMGIDPNDGRDAAQVMVELAQRLVTMQDKTVASYAANALLGKSYAELRPFMQEVVEKGQLTATTTDAQVQKAKELKDEYARLKLQTDLNVRQVTEGMLPALKDIVGAFKEAKGSGQDFTGLGEVLGTMLKGAAAIALTAADVFYGLGKSIGGAAAAATLAAQGEFRAAANAWKEANDEVEGHTKLTDERIARMWGDTASQVKQSAAEIAAAGNSAGSGPKVTGDAEAGVRQLMEEKKNYQARLAELKGFSDRFTELTRAQIQQLQLEHQQGVIGERELLERERALEHERLNVKISTMQQELVLAQRQGDLTREQELKNGIAQAQAAKVTVDTISKARTSAWELDEKREAARQMTQLQRENMTEREALSGQYAEKLRLLEKAELSGLYTQDEISQQRVLLETKYQAAMGNISAQGIMARRNFEQLTLTEQMQNVFGTMAAITAGAAQHNRKMFEINKAAGIANAVINTAVGVTNALSAYPPPLSFIMAALQAAAGIIQISTISKQSFEDGAGTVSTPTFNANPNTGFPEQPGAGAPAGFGPPQQPAPPQPRDINITFVGSGRYTQQEIRDGLVPALNEALGDGVQLNVQVSIPS